MATGFALESAWVRRRRKRQGYYYNLVKADMGGTAKLVWETWYFGAAPGGGNAPGLALTETLSLSSGAAAGSASASGLALTETLSLSSGAAAGSASASGLALTETLSLSSGSATGSASASGLALTETYTITGGGAAVAVDGNALGATLVLALSFSGGAAIVVTNGNAPGFASGWTHLLQGGYAVGRPQLTRTISETASSPRSIDPGGRVPVFVHSGAVLGGRNIDAEAPLPPREVEIA